MLKMRRKDLSTVPLIQQEQLPSQGAIGERWCQCHLLLVTVEFCLDLFSYDINAHINGFNTKAVCDQKAVAAAPCRWLLKKLVLDVIISLFGLLYNFFFFIVCVCLLGRHQSKWGEGVETSSSAQKRWAKAQDKKILSPCACHIIKLF